MHFLICRKPLLRSFILYMAIIKFSTMFFFYYLIRSSCFLYHTSMYICQSHKHTCLHTHVMLHSPFIKSSPSLHMYGFMSLVALIIVSRIVSGFIVVGFVVLDHYMIRTGWGGVVNVCCSWVT